MRYERLLARLFSAPLLAEPVAATVVARVLLTRAGMTNVRFEMPGGAPVMPPAPDMLATATEQDVIRRRREYQVLNGVATIPVLGELTSRSYALEPESGLTGYNAIGQSLDMALADGDVAGIVLDIDSPGGETGVFDLGRRVRAANAIKPVWAIVGRDCCSAAYAIASGAGRITAPADGRVGSVGVIGLHTDLSGALAKEGVKVTILKFGENKADGNPFEPLGPDVAQRWKADIDALGVQFVKLVAEHRGTTQKAVRETEADVFMGAAALDLRLIDAVQPAHEALAEFTDFLNRGANRRPAKERGMTAQPTDAAGDAASASNVTRADLDAATVRATAAGRDEGLNAGRSEGRAAERTRIAAVLRSEQATGRTETAMSLALDTDLPADQAVRVLASTPKAEAASASRAAATPTPHTDFRAAMAAAGNPEVGPDRGESGDDLDQILLRARQREGRG